MSLQTAIEWPSPEASADADASRISWLAVVKQAIAAAEGGPIVDVAAAAATAGQPRPQWPQRSQPQLQPRPQRQPRAYLRNPQQAVRQGEIFSLMEVSYLSTEELTKMFEVVSGKGRGDFQRFAGRSILDFKVQGEETVHLRPPHTVLDPLVATMVALARCSLRADEELAIIQLIVNYFPDGSDNIKSHRHRCRQVCASLGATRELEVDGRTVHMRHGDVLPLGGEMHSVPPAKGLQQPRVSVCLFYGSKKEYTEQSISVNATTTSFGDSFWWTHPRELDEAMATNYGFGWGDDEARATTTATSGDGRGGESWMADQWQVGGSWSSGPVGAGRQAGSSYSSTAAAATGAARAPRGGKGRGVAASAPAWGSDVPNSWDGPSRRVWRAGYPVAAPPQGRWVPKEVTDLSDDAGEQHEVRDGAVAADQRSAGGRARKKVSLYAGRPVLERPARRPQPRGGQGGWQRRGGA